MTSKIVPREPTQEMDDAASNVDRSNLPGKFRREVWRAMYDAAPTQEPDEGLLLLVESTANMLRGMLLEPQIPERAKIAMLQRIEMLEQAVEDRA